ncbi:MAG: Magnesium transporter MgtE [Alphaproteobacteria bacterium MarineAlpha5_Bin11]|nr:MAG: Magnesium transporter MgtE [Alphaproteobacteria bacterium MarineAlpha5_Bin11]PPR51743.1 MAG: Magnesium transporter MgtE [Alphaproteobacteria bacterium MarineAlpha5_Bin10]
MDNSNITVNKENTDQDVSKEPYQLIKSLLQKNNIIEIKKILNDNHAADIAELIQNLEDIHRNKLLEILREKFDLEILTYLDENIKDEIIEFLGIETLAPNVKQLDVDDAVDVVEDLEKSDQETVLNSLPIDERKLIEEGLNYPEDSAGRLMQRNFVSIDTEWTVGQTIDYLRSNTNLPTDFYDIYLKNDQNIIKGTVPLGRLMSSKREILLKNIKNKENRVILANTDQEEVAYIFNKYGLVSAPVVNQDKELIGSITVDDVVDVIEEEREEDILKLGGVGQADLFSAITSTTKSRFSWLLVNLLTAIVASIVIGFFQASIEKVVALAVLMPIVASMGGNAGTQTLTIAVRALATKELTASNALKIVGKETFVGGVNGFIFALILGTVSGFWFNDKMLGIIIALAMIINLIIAGLAGTLIPITLNKLRIDPALASGVILTTITDVIGFLSFLGLASILLI